jgi:hypothetical protein
MIDRKQVRETVGLTHEVLKLNPDAWFRVASSFHAAVVVLEEFSDRIPSDSRPFALNAALSLELIFKAVLVKKNRPIPDDSRGHDLLTLCELAEVTLSNDQRLTLELMTQELIWFARYPVSKRPEKFDQFYDEILEKHIIRTKSGNVHSVRANPKTFSNFENYEKIWRSAVEELQGL